MIKYDHMNYIDQAATTIKRHVHPSALPDADTTNLFRAYAALMYAKHAEVTAKDVHNVWAAWALTHDPSNVDIRPFIELPIEVQREDSPFAAAIRQAWREITS